MDFNDLEIEGHMWANWGYVIYRTTYAPGTDAQWTTALCKLDAYMQQEEKLSRDPDNRLSNFRWIEMNDERRFSGASIDAVRQHFTTWVRSRGKESLHGNSPMHTVCLVVDEEVLRSIMDAPMPPCQKYDYRDWALHYVKLVDVTFDPATIPNSPDHLTYRGWYKLAINKLIIHYLEMRDIDGDPKKYAPPAFMGEYPPYCPPY